MISSENILIIDQLEKLWSRLITKDVLLFSAYGGDLYSGEVGHCLFLFTYWERERNKNRKKDLSEKVMDVLDRVLNQEFTAGFFQGTMGSISILFKIINALELPIDSSIIERVAKKVGQVAIVGINDISNGNSGTLYGLFYLIGYLPVLKKEVEDKSVVLLGFLLANVRYSKEGIYWDVTPFQSKSLCGFSHGNAGVAFVFSEIGKLLNNDLLIKISKSAISHEDSLYHKGLNNWPDFRMSHTELTSLKRKLLKNNQPAFNDIGDTKGWCHGFPGVALSRHSILCVHSEAKTVVQLKRLEIQLLQLIDLWDDNGNIGLCHGLSGLLHIWQSISSPCSKRSKAIQFKNANSVLLNCCLSTPSDGANFGLFNGILGVYYYLLKLQSSDDSFNVLAPALDHTEKITVPIAEEDFVKGSCRQLLKGYLSAQQIEILLKNLVITVAKYSFEDLFKLVVQHLRPVDKEGKLASSLLLMHRDYLCRDRDVNGLYDYVKNLLLFESIRIDISEKAHLQRLHTVVPKGVYLIKSKRDKLGKLKDKDAPVYLTIQHGKKVSIIEIGFLTKIIIQKAHQHNELHTVFLEVLKTLSASTSDTLYYELIEKQINELKKIGYLIISPLYEN